MYPLSLSLSGVPPDLPLLCNLASPPVMETLPWGAVSKTRPSTEGDKSKPS